MPNREKLTIKQERFCREYVKTGHGTNSAKLAGYSEKTAFVQSTENLRKPNIIKEIERLLKPEIKAVQITQEFILQKLRENAEKASSDEFYNASGVNKAIELLGKHIGMFNDKVEAPVVNVTINQVEFKAAIEGARLEYFSE